MLHISEIVKKTEDIFDRFNEHFYRGELPRPAITVSPDGGRNALGWCSINKIWNKGEEGYYEINLCAEYLDRPLAEIAEVMLHEMAHLYNAIHNINDTSNNGYYHNVKYKETAEAHGLRIEKHPKYGWMMSTLKPDAYDWIIDTMGDVGLGASRLPEGKGKGKTKSKNRSKKYVCPSCGTIIRATKEVHVICGDCHVPFELEEAEDDGE